MAPWELYELKIRLKERQLEEGGDQEDIKSLSNNIHIKSKKFEPIMAELLQSAKEIS